MSFAIGISRITSFSRSVSSIQVVVFSLLLISECMLLNCIQVRILIGAIDIREILLLVVLFCQQEATLHIVLVTLNRSSRNLKHIHFIIARTIIQPTAQRELLILRLDFLKQVVPGSRADLLRQSHI